MILDYNYLYTTIMLIITYILEASLLAYVCSYYFKISIIKMIPLIFILSFQQYYINKEYYIVVMMITMILYLYFVNKIKNIYAFLVPIVSITIYMCAQSIVRLFTHNAYMTYSNLYKVIIIQLLIVLLLKNISYRKMTNQTAVNITLSCILLIYNFHFFIKLLLNQFYTRLEVILLGINTVALFFLLIQHILLFNDILVLNDDLNRDLSNQKYLEYNKTIILNKFNEIKLMKHNMKYLLMNLNIYIKNKDLECASSYIQSYLDKISSTKVCFTDNPCFDYIINEFDDYLKQKNMIAEKDIFVDSNCYINDLKHVDQIKNFLNNQLEYMKRYDKNMFHLTIHQKGDFVLFKAIHNNNGIVINKMIIKKDD